ncbi:MAG: GNAT family N-acetyltransferase [Bacteroidales bacterium]
MESTHFDLQLETLQNDVVRLIPVQSDDFERLYKVASDPLIWEQHPDKERYKKERFQLFFDSALQSKGAFLVFDNASNKLIGSTRFYEYSPEKKSIAIGFTFIAREYWGGAHNSAMKKLLLNYAFQFVSSVVFHIGALNIRSQKAILKLGATKIGETNSELNGIESINFEFEIKREDWEK